MPQFLTSCKEFDIQQVPLIVRKEEKRKELKLPGRNMAEPPGGSTSLDHCLRVLELPYLLNYPLFPCRVKNGKVYGGVSGLERLQKGVKIHHLVRIEITCTTAPASCWGIFLLVPLFPRLIFPILINLFLLLSICLCPPHKTID